MPVILVHGSGATDARTWGNQIEPFAARFRVIAYSQRYHFPNAWDDRGMDFVSTQVRADDLAALIVALDLGCAHLVGSSFGADVVLRLAADQPELVRALVVAEPALFSWIDTLPGGPEMFAEFTQTMVPAKEAVRGGDLELGARLFIDAALGSGLYDQLPPSLHNRVRDNVRLVGAEPTDMSELTTDITRDDAARIKLPTLLLTGDESPQMYLMVSRELARRIPNVEQAQISGASHILHSMNPQSFNATVLSFLAKHTS